MRRRNRTGSILIDFLVSLMIVSLLIPVIVGAVSLTAQTLDFDETVQDTIASQQLRKMLLLSYDVQTDGEVLYFTYQERQMRAGYMNHHVIVQPGTQIFFSDIDSAFFFVDGSVIYIEYTRGNFTYDIAVAKVS